MSPETQKNGINIENNEKLPDITISLVQILETNPTIESIYNPNGGFITCKDIFGLILPNTKNSALQDIIPILSQNPIINRLIIRLSGKKDITYGAAGNSILIIGKGSNKELYHQINIQTYLYEFNIFNHSLSYREKNSQENIFETSIHELLHNFTAYIFGANNSDLLYESEKEYKIRMESLHKEYINKYPNNNGYEESIKEFVVRILTNEKFKKNGENIIINGESLYQESLKETSLYINNLERNFQTHIPSKKEDGSKYKPYEVRNNASVDDKTRISNIAQHLGIEASSITTKQQSRLLAAHNYNPDNSQIFEYDPKVLILKMEIAMGKYAIDPINNHPQKDTKGNLKPNPDFNVNKTWISNKQAKDLIRRGDLGLFN